MTFLTSIFVEILSFGHLFCNFHRKISALKLGRGRSKGGQEKKSKNSGKMHRGQTALPWPVTVLQQQWYHQKLQSTVSLNYMFFRVIWQVFSEMTEFFYENMKALAHNLYGRPAFVEKLEEF